MLRWFVTPVTQWLLDPNNHAYRSPGTRLSSQSSQFSQPVLPALYVLYYVLTAANFTFSFVFNAAVNYS